MFDAWMERRPQPHVELLFLNKQKAPILRSWFIANLKQDPRVWREAYLHGDTPCLRGRSPGWLQWKIKYTWICMLQWKRNRYCNYQQHITYLKNPTAGTNQTSNHDCQNAKLFQVSRSRRYLDEIGVSSLASFVAFHPSSRKCSFTPSYWRHRCSKIGCLEASAWARWEGNSDLLSKSCDRSDASTQWPSKSWWSSNRSLIRQGIKLR